MNIFILSWIIENCAKYHCNLHVVKMILESVQLISTCHHMTQPDVAEKWVSENRIYKKTHMNHPCSIWVRECKENYIWLCHFGLALCKEWAYRYDHKPSDHKCHSILMFLINNVPPLPENGGVITKPKMAMPDQYKSEDPIMAYRTYYLNDKAKMLVWSKRQPPYWVPNSSRNVHYESELSRLNKQLDKLNSRVRKTSDHLDQIEKLKCEIKRLSDEYNQIKRLSDEYNLIK